MHLATHLAQLLSYRALVGVLTGRELKSRYRGSVLGFLWTFLNPLLLLLVYSLVFSVYFRVQMDHYSVFMFTGLVPWVFFSGALMEGTGAITDSGGLVTKVTFPMQVLPAVKVMANFYNFLLTLPILAVFYLVGGVPLTIHAVAFPLVAAVHLGLAFGLALILSTACVFMRDTRHILNNLLTLWFFLTPILYPPSQVPGPFQPLIVFNPMALLTMAYHDCLFWHRWPNWQHLGIMILLTLFVLWLGSRVFDSYKEYFAEKI